MWSPQGRAARRELIFATNAIFLRIAMYSFPFEVRRGFTIELRWKRTTYLFHDNVPFDKKLDSAVDSSLHEMAYGTCSLNLYLRR